MSISKQGGVPVALVGNTVSRPPFYTCQQAYDIAHAADHLCPYRRQSWSLTYMACTAFDLPSGIYPFHI